MPAVTLKILRYDPHPDTRPHRETYTVEAEPSERVLDLLNRIKWFQDGSLTYRRSCTQGICGSDARQINDRNRLACKTLGRNVSQPITVSPLVGFTVIRDLVVDLGPFFRHVLADSQPPLRRLGLPRRRQLCRHLSWVGSRCVILPVRDSPHAPGPGNALRRIGWLPARWRHRRTRDFVRFYSGRRVVSSDGCQAVSL